MLWALLPDIPAIFLPRPGFVFLLAVGFLIQDVEDVFAGIGQESDGRSAEYHNIDSYATYL